MENSEGVKKEILPNTEETTFEIGPAITSITINHENHSLWINGVASSVKGEGYGTKLLDELKKKYSDYTITGQANPTEFDNSDRPTDEEMLRAYNLGLSPAGKNRAEFQNPGFELTPQQKDFVKDVAERFNTSHTDPVGRLFNFYRKNGFNLSPSGSGFFESKPPHKLSGEIVSTDKIDRIDE